MSTCKWVTDGAQDAEAELFSTPHRQLVVQHGELVIEVVANFLKASESDELFHFLEVTMHGQEAEMHGLLGQNAALPMKQQVQVGVFGKELSEYKGGVQGEGAIQGVYTDYEVSDLLSSDFAYSLFQC